MVMMLIVWSMLSCGAPSPSKEYSSSEKKELYDTYCGLCHGYEGEGYLAPQANALSNQDFLSAATDDFILDAILDGRPGSKMSPWGVENGGPLTLKEAEAIAEYIRAWQQEPSADIHTLTFEGSIEEGLIIYAEQCAFCHGADGEGASALSLNHPEFLSEASDGFIWHALSVGRRGTAMSSYAEILSEEELAHLVVLIRSWE
jgi:cytochrome c oxidase cbb3-type subunit III